MPLQIRRGTNAERLNMTQPLASGELLYVTDDQRLYIGNASSLGGVQITGYTDEDAQDAAAELFTNGTHTGIVFTYNDALNRIDATVDLAAFDGPIVADSLKGSVFADDSSIIVDSIDKIVYATLTGNVVGNVTGNLTGDAAGAHTGTFNGAASGTFSGTATGTLNGNVVGDVQGSVFADDSTKLIDGVSGDISNGTLTLSGSVLSGTAIGSIYDTLISANVPVVAIGTRAEPGALFVEGENYPLTIRGEANAAEGVNFSIQAARYTGTTLTPVVDTDLLGQLAFEGFEGTAFKKAAVIGSVVTSAIVADNFSADLTVNVLNQDGLYRPFAFRANGTFDAGFGVKVYNGTDSELTAFGAIVTEGTFGYGAERSAPVFYDGAQFTTLTSVVAVPAGPTAAGKAGQIAGDANYIYFCYGASTWVRVAKDGTWT